VGIYADEYLDFRSGFRDQDAETHRHPSLHMMLLLVAGCEVSKIAEFPARLLWSSLKIEVVRHTEHHTADGSAADVSFVNLGVLSLMKLPGQSKSHRGGSFRGGGFSRELNEAVGTAKRGRRRFDYEQRDLTFRRLMSTIVDVPHR